VAVGAVDEKKKKKKSKRPRKDVAEFAATAAAPAVVAEAPIPPAAPIAVEPVLGSEAPSKKSADKKNASRKNSSDGKAAPIVDAGSIASAIKTSQLKEEDIQSLLDLLVKRQASVSEWRPANGGMDAAAILKKQLEDKDQEVKEIQNLNKSLKVKLDTMRTNHVQEKNRLALMESQVQERCERQAQELRNLRLQVQQEQENHMSERAALQQKVAALEATTQNAAEQASHYKAVQENHSQVQANYHKLTQEVQLLHGELSKSQAKTAMAESATAKAVEVVRQETEVVMNDAEARHRAQMRELEAQLHDAALAAAAKEEVIGDLTSKLTLAEEDRVLLQKKLNEALSCMPPTSERPAGDGQENPPAPAVETLVAKEAETVEAAPAETAESPAADEDDEVDAFDFFEAVPLGSAAREAEKAEEAAAAAAAAPTNRDSISEVSQVVAELEGIVKSKDVEISSLQNELTVLKLEVVAMREELAQMTDFAQTATPPTEAPEVEVLTDVEESKSSESLLNADSPIPSDKKSNSDSDEDYILIEKEEGVAAEAAATAAAEVELTTTTAAAPPAEIPSLIPSTQMTELQNEISSLHDAITEKDATITSLKVELKDAMSELLTARENLTTKDGEIQSLRESKLDMENRLSSLDHQLEEQRTAAADAPAPQVVEVIKEVETIVEVPVAVPDSSRVELETEISHYKGLLKETESMLERLQAGVEEEEEKWRRIVDDKEEELQKTRSALSQAQVERQADVVRLNTRLEALQAEKVPVIDSETSSPPPELVEYAQTDGQVVEQDADADLGTSV